MQLHARLTGSASGPRCRTLVGGFGLPGQRDLDFGEKFIRYAESLEWPADVVLEDLSYSAHLVLHRLQELRPAKLVLVGAVSRGAGPPGTIRTYRLDAAPPPPQDVHHHLVEAVGGEVGLDHTLAVAGHWGGLPQDTTVVEVEAADASFGLGFSEELAAAMDALLEIVREELAAQAPVSCQDRAAAWPEEPLVRARRAGWCNGGAVEHPEPAGSPGIAQLFDYADAHRELRRLEAFAAALPPVAGVSIAARFLPAGRALRTSGNWYDVIPLPTGVGLAMGDVATYGREAASDVAQLRATVRAFALLHGNRPGRLIELLDRVPATTGVGVESTLVYASVDPFRGEVAFSNSGHAPPLLLTPGRPPEFLESARSGPLGITRGDRKPEATVRLPPGSTLLLFTTGLVTTPERPMRQGLQQLRQVVADGPVEAEALCDHVLAACLPETRDRDASLLTLCLPPVKAMASRVQT